MKLKNISKYIVIVIICILCMSAQVYATSVAVKIDLPKTVETGKVFNVKVQYMGDTFSRVYSELSYDPNMIEYISGGNSSGNGGTVLLKQGGDENGKVDFTLKFKATNKGSTEINVDTIEIYNMDGMYLDASPAKGELTVEAVALKPDSEKEEIDELEKNEEDLEAKKDNDKTDDEMENHEDKAPSTMMFWGIIIVGLIILLIVITLISKKVRKNR